MATNYIAPTWRMPENTNKDKLSNYSLELNGTDEYLNFPSTNFLNNGQASFSFWIKPYTYGGNNYGYFFSGSSSAVGGIAYSEGGSSGSYYPGVLYWYNGSVSTILDVVATENVWNHFVIVFNGTSLKTYKNGSLGTTKTITAATTLAFDTIGRYKPANTHYIKGDLSQMCIFDYALTDGTNGTANQIEYLYNLNNPMTITGEKPVLYYSLGDNSNPRAIAGYPNLSIEGSVFNFVNPSDGINVPSSNVFNFGTGDFTISMWFKINSFPSFPYLFDFRPTSSPLTDAPGVYISTTTNRANLFGGGTIIAGSAGKILATGVWYNFVVKRSGNTFTTHYDGGSADQTGTNTVDFNTDLELHIGSRYDNINGFDGEISNFQVFNTALPQTGSNSIETIYNNGSPLTSMSGFNSLQGWWKLDASATYDGSNWTIPDDSTNSNDGTSSGMTQANLVRSDLYRTTPYSNYSVSFNGGTEYMRTPTNYGSYLSGATSCSVSVWVKVDNTAIQQPVVSVWDQIDTTKSYLIRYFPDSRRFQFYLWGPVGAGDSRFGLANTGKTISTNTWYHIVGTWDGTTIKIYQDGVLEGSENAPGGALQTVNEQNFTGRYRTTFFNGDISNQAFWKNTALTEGEIVEIYNGGVTTDLNNFSGTAPTFWYPMDEKSTYFPGTNHPTELYIRDVTSDRYSSGSNMDTSNFVGNAPGSSINGTGTNLDISNLKGDMSNSTKNSYSINMADYGDPNNQGVTPANSGRSTDTP